MLMDLFKTAKNQEIWHPHENEINLIAGTACIINIR